MKKVKESGSTVRMDWDGITASSCTNPLVLKSPMHQHLLESLLNEDGGTLRQSF